jgi:magnesium transporter
MEARKNTQAILQQLREQLDSGELHAARELVHGLHPSEVAHVLESMPIEERSVLWDLVDVDEGDVLVEVVDEVRDGLIKDMQPGELIAATDGMELDDLADLLIDLPEDVTQEVLRSLDEQDQERLRQVLAYDEDCAGGLMNVDIVTVRPDVTVEVVGRYLRAKGEIADGTDSIFVVDRNNEYIGSIYLSRLLTADSATTVDKIMSTDTLPIPATTPSADVVWEFEHRDLLSAAVVDEDNRVLGRITVDDVVDEIRDEAEHSLMSAAGLDEEDDMFAPVTRSAARHCAARRPDAGSSQYGRCRRQPVANDYYPRDGAGADRSQQCTADTAQGIDGRRSQRCRMGNRRSGGYLSLVWRLAHWRRNRCSDAH